MRIPPIILAAAERSGRSPSEPGDWATALDGEALLTCALYATLQAAGDPVPSDQIRAVVGYVVWPGMALGIEPALQRRLQRLVGPAIWRRPVAPLGDWARVIQRGVAHECIVLDARGHWSAGPEIYVSDPALLALAVVMWSEFLRLRGRP